MKSRSPGGVRDGKAADYLDTLVMRGLMETDHVRPLIPPLFSSTFLTLQQDPEGTGRPGDTRETIESPGNQPHFTERESSMRGGMTSQRAPPPVTGEGPASTGIDRFDLSQPVIRPVLPGKTASVDHAGIPADVYRDQPEEKPMSPVKPNIFEQRPLEDLRIAPVIRPQLAEKETWEPLQPGEQPENSGSGSGLPEQKDRTVSIPEKKPQLRVFLAPELTPVPKTRTPPPSVNVTIGRIEVRAVSPPQKKERDTMSARVMTLHDYLSRKKGGKP